AFERQTDAEIERVDGIASLAKVTATDAAVENCKMATEIMGQTGLRQDQRVEKILRDSKLLQIYEGTNQINRVNVFKRFIARHDPRATVFSRHKA
ncbi:MAG: acyl-CoA dehydrogenase family protein, partial [Thermodesulfobacteriota bacterium]